MAVKWGLYKRMKYKQPIAFYRMKDLSLHIYSQSLKADKTIIVILNYLPCAKHH